MIWELAEQVLCNCTASILKSEEKSMGISCILPAGYHGVRSLSALVCGTPEELRPWLDGGNAHSLLVLAPPSAALPADWGPHPNVALVNTQEHLDICLAALHSAMEESTRIEAGHQRLLKLITASTPLTQLLNEVAGIYGHYADILDTALNILAFSNQIEPPEPSLPFEHAHGYIKPHVVRYLRDSGVLREMSLPRPTRVLDPQRNTYAYSVPVRLTPMVKIGYLCVFTRADEMLSTTELFYLAQTAQLLSLEMQRDRFYTTNKAVYFTHLLNDLLQGVLPKSGSYEDRFSVFSYQLRQWKHIIVLRTGSELQPSININALSEQLQTLFGNSVYLIQDDYLIYLTSQADSASLPAEQLESWSSALNDLGLHIGVSSAFENSIAAGTYLRQAKQALKIGQRFEPSEYIHQYDRLRIPDLFSQVAPESSLHSFCYPPLMRLIEWDGKKEQGDLLDTLRCFLAHNQSVVDTCKELYIHRNTLYHRLERIQEIMGCQLSDPMVVTQIELTFLLLRYLGEEP